MKIAKDKILHALINYIIVVVLSLLWCTMGAILTAVVVSIGKEIYDTYKANATGFDLFDLVADGTGIVLGLLTYLISQLW